MKSKWAVLPISISFIIVWGIPLPPPSSHRISNRPRPAEINYIVWFIKTYEGDKPAKMDIKPLELGLFYPMVYPTMHGRYMLFLLQQVEVDSQPEFS